MPCDYQLFKDLKKFLGGTRFQNGDEVKIAVLNCIWNLDEKYFEEGLVKLVYWYNKCLSVMGNYVEK